MRKSKYVQVRTACFECLETRAMLAGNVAAVVVSGDLELQGEAAGNAVQVWQTGPTTWKVQGIATTVNGSHSSFTASGVTSIEAIFPDGNSFINVFNGTVPSVLHINDTGKNNTVQIINLTTVFGMDISTGNGTSLVSLTKVTIEDDGLGISTGNGTSVVTLTTVTVEDEGLGISTGNGHNAITLTGVTVEDDGLGISTGDGTNVVALTKVTVEDEGLGISTGNGTSVVTLTNVTVEDEGLGISTGNGTSVISLTKVTVEDEGLGISTGSGPDAVSLNTVNVGSDDLGVDLGSGNYDSVAVVNCTAGTEHFADVGGTNGTIVGTSNHFATLPVVSGFKYRFGI